MQEVRHCPGLPMGRRTGQPWGVQLGTVSQNSEYSGSFDSTITLSGIYPTSTLLKGCVCKVSNCSIVCNNNQ